MRVTSHRVRGTGRFTKIGSRGREIGHLTRERYVLPLCIKCDLSVKPIFLVSDASDIYS